MDDCDGLKGLMRPSRASPTLPPIKFLSAIVEVPALSTLPI